MVTDRHLNHLTLSPMLKPVEGDVSVMANPDLIAEALRENWIGICRDCDWEHTDIGSIGVSAESRVHLHNKEGHTVDVYRDGDLMETIEELQEGEKEYLGQDTPPLEELDQEDERIASEVADRDS